MIRKRSTQNVCLGALSVAAFLSLCSCKEKNAAGDFPDNFASLSDVAKVKYLMEHTTPDSVARFICNASLGKISGIRIDTLSSATLYAYENYKGKDFDTFSIEYDSYSNSLPLAEKMKLLFNASPDDPMQIGYELGLSYVSQIREQHKTPEQVEQEIREFRKACGSDTETYSRFIKGFKIALESDHGKDLSEDIYRRFINFN